MIQAPGDIRTQPDWPIVPFSSPPAQVGQVQIRMIRMVLLGLLAGSLSAGPPFKTDDPQPVELGHLELYLFSAGQHSPGSSTGMGPAVEFNYGILRDTQIHLVVPYAYNRPRDSPPQGGLGDVEIGVKFRILQETTMLPQVGVFPLVELPFGDVDKGLGAGHTQIYLPIWVQKSWGPWTTYGGYGWWRNPGDKNQNWSYLGWLIQRDLGERMTLGVEAFRHSASTMIGQRSTGFNVGGQVNLSENHHLLFSVAGMSVEKHSRTSMSVTNSPPGPWAASVNGSIEVVATHEYPKRLAKKGMMMSQMDPSAKA